MNNNIRNVEKILELYQDENYSSQLLSVMLFFKISSKYYYLNS